MKPKKKIENYKEAYLQAIKKLSLSDQSCNEILNYLKKYECDDSIAQAVVKRLLEQNYINDERLCKNICEFYSNNASFGKYLLKQKLLKRCINEKIINDVLISLDFDEYFYANKVFLSFMKKNTIKSKKDIAKFMRHMVAKGFSYGIISNIISDNKDYFVIIDENSLS